MPKKITVTTKCLALGCTRKIKGGMRGFCWQHSDMQTPQPIAPRAVYLYPEKMRQKCVIQRITKYARDNKREECSRPALFSIDGLPMCRQHAQEAALAICMGSKP